MGVIENRIKVDSHRKVYPEPVIPHIPDTSASSINLELNITGFVYYLEKLTSTGLWDIVGSRHNTAYFNPSVSLSEITETSTCRLAIQPYGSDRTFFFYSNEFIVTR